MIKLWVGLGNPGPQYEDTRHNAGFWFTDGLARLWKTTLQFDRTYYGLVARVSIQGENVWLLQPHTFMNLSGKSVGALARFFKIEPGQILVAHDELDLPPGVAKLKKGGSSGGHNGLKDISAALGTQDYWRLRIGIGHPREMNLQQAVVDFVLHRPRKEEQNLIDIAIENSLKIMPFLIEGQFEKAMMELHTDKKP